MTNCSLVSSVTSTCLLPKAAIRAPGRIQELKLKTFRLGKLLHYQNEAGPATIAFWDGEFCGRTNRRSVGERVSWKCYSDLKSSETESSDSSEASDSRNCCDDTPGQGASAASGEDVPASSTSSSTTQQFETYGPGKRGNQLVALVSVSVAVGLFALGRVGGATPTLPQLAAQSTPYEVALGNGKPTVVEFYADWCEVCREMAKDVYVIEQEYKDKINFVMLNVDNTKWEAELDEFGVEGIPHFAFLDGKGNEEGNVVGRLPRKILQENLEALARGDPTIPHSRAVGKFSDADSRQAPPVVGPRSHSQSS
ncbi:hypothetical protein R1sor_013200 [Riccia sorocarpa]|uniref:Thioredoxin domain-containing protein n=1 Tax=Riccia sorocarpa TaxID=122646 RepID=A0ABD3H9X1_9MARC